MSTTSRKNPPRWTTKETAILRDRVGRPFREVFPAYQEAGYGRSRSAVSVRFYALRQASREEAAGGTGSGRPGPSQPESKAAGPETTTHMALELAAKHDVAMLTAALEIRVVLDRMG